VYRPPFNVSAWAPPRATLPALGEHDAELVEMLIERSARQRS